MCCQRHHVGFPRLRSYPWAPLEEAWARAHGEVLTLSNWDPLEFQGEVRKAWQRGYHDLGYSARVLPLARVGGKGRLEQLASALLAKVLCVLNHWNMF